MAGFKTPNFNDRLSNAQKVRQAALEKFKAKPGVNDPEFKARQAELMRIEQERQARREAARLEKERLAAEEAARLAAEAEARKKAEEEAYQAELREKIELLAKQKAARDARYAARKAAKKGR